MKIFDTTAKRIPSTIHNDAHRSVHIGKFVQRNQQAEIQNILRATGAQAKLTIGQPNDKYEQEADRVADHVMRMHDPQVVSTSDRTQPYNVSSPTIQGK